MIRDLKEDSNKQIDEVMKSIQDLDKKVRYMEKKFSKVMEIMKINQIEMLEIKTTVTRTNRRKNIRDGGLA
jgi:hypothetical protein